MPTVRHKDHILWEPIRIACKIICSLFGVWLTGFIIFIHSIQNFPSDDNRVTDTIVVLTGGQDRLDEGFALLEKGKAKIMLISGVHKNVSKTTLLRLHDKVSLKEKVFLDQEATNTIENALETKKWIQQYEKQAPKIRSIRLITAGYHMPRSLIEFQRVLPHLLLVPHPIYPTSIKKTWWLWPGTTWLLTREYTKYLITLIQFWLEKWV